jgi:hypothetical protein
VQETQCDCIGVSKKNVLKKKNEKNQTVEATQRDVKLVLFELRDLKVFFFKKIRTYANICIYIHIYVRHFPPPLFQASSLQEEKNSSGWPGLLSPKGGGFKAWSTFSQRGDNGSVLPELGPVLPELAPSVSMISRPEELPHYDEWKSCPRLYGTNAIIRPHSGQ